MKNKTKVFVGEIKEVNEKDGTLTALVSTGAVDRMGDIIEPKGVDVKNFNKNPVVLWAHSHRTPPIGKSLWIKKTEEGVLSKVKFAPSDFAQEIFQLFKDGFMNAFSIGFIPKEWEDITDKKGRWLGFLFKKVEMIEFSAVPVPANPEALALAFSKGIIREDTKNILEDSIERFERVMKKEEEEEKKPEEAEEPAEEEKPEEDPPADPPEEEKGSQELYDTIDNQERIIELRDAEIVGLKGKVAELQLALYKELKDPDNKLFSEITGKGLAKQIGESITGVIRELTGKVS